MININEMLLQVDIMEDQTASPDQLREAFRGIAKDKVCNVFFFCFDKTIVRELINHFHKPFVTELDLRIASLPAAAIDFLRQAMPSGRNDSGEAEYDYERFIDQVLTWRPL